MRESRVCGVWTRTATQASHRKKPRAPFNVSCGLSHEEVPVCAYPTSRRLETAVCWNVLLLHWWGGSCLTVSVATGRLCSASPIWLHSLSFNHALSTQDDFAWKLIAFILSHPDKEEHSRYTIYLASLSQTLIFAEAWWSSSTLAIPTKAVCSVQVLLNYLLCTVE